MSQKLPGLVAVLMICMPIGGLAASGPILEAGPLATASPVSNPWLVGPVHLLFLCAVLLISSRIEQYHRRKS